MTIHGSTITQQIIMTVVRVRQRQQLVIMTDTDTDYSNQPWN